MQTPRTQQTHDTRAVLKKLTLKKETLRRLTPSELRVVAGGAAPAPFRSDGCYP
jgi:hypothetical protein